MILPPRPEIKPAPHALSQSLDRQGSPPKDMILKRQSQESSRDSQPGAMWARRVHWRVEAGEASRALQG